MTGALTVRARTPDALMQTSKTSNRARPATVVSARCRGRFQGAPGAVAGAEIGGQMATPYRGPRLAATSADSARADGQTSNGHAVQEGGGLACLDALAAQLHARGWTSYINAPAGRLTSLVVQDPRDRAERGGIIAAPAGPAGTWWYWFSWAERIAPVNAPAAAADAVIRAFQRPADAAVVPL
jgi:hypothetical protein